MILRSIELNRIDLSLPIWHIVTNIRSRIFFSIGTDTDNAIGSVPLYMKIKATMQ